MNVEILTLSEVTPRARDVAIGVFDGVHRGHRKVIEGARTVLTFDPHPMAVLRPEAAPKLLTPRGLKARLLSELGVEEMVVIEFDREFSQLTAEQFVEQVLVERLGATSVAVGENFRFGTGAQGDPEFLAEFDAFETRVVPLVEVDGEIVSSTRVRDLLVAGDVKQAAELLVVPFTLRGEVVHGDKRGRELGFPTANVVPDERLCIPGHGVYAALTDGMPSAVNVGVRPTFESDRGLLVESTVIDWSGDLYGETIEISFLERLRGEQRFDDAEALVAQMHDDVARAAEICAGAGRTAQR